MSSTRDRNKELASSSSCRHRQWLNWEIYGQKERGENTKVKKPRTQERAERSKEEQKHTIAAAAERDGSWTEHRRSNTRQPRKSTSAGEAKRQSSSERGIGGGGILFRAFPNLKSKPKIIVLGLDYRTLSGLGRVVVFTLWKKNTVCPPHVWAPNDSDSNMVQIWCDWW